MFKLVQNISYFFIINTTISEPAKNGTSPYCPFSSHSIEIPGLDKKSTISLNSLISSIKSTQSTAYETETTLELRPWFYFLKDEVNCAVFQNKSVPEIIKEVCREAGFTQIKDSLTKTYKPLEYVVQYNENSFEFLSRLMEEAGIFYFFIHSKTDHTLVLGDSPQAFQPCKEAETVEWLGGTFPETPSKHLWNVCLSEKSAPKSFKVDDHNYLTPTASLSAKAGKGFPQSGGFGSGHLTQAEGEEIAARGLDGFESQALEMTAETTCTALTVGSTFTLKGCPQKEANRKWVVAGLEMEVFEGGAVKMKIKAWPADAPHRPIITRPKPHMGGPLTGIVTGKSGEEIWTDKHGGVKVLFHWDRKGKNDENSSCWLRVAQPWAGPGYGAIFIPRVGQEVLINFIGGDPCRPIVTGTLYNAANTPPWPLPDAAATSGIKSLSTPKGKEGNELRLDDKKDEERFYIHAKKLLEYLVEEEQRLTVKGEGGDSTILEKGPRLVDIKEGNDTLTLGKGSHQTTLSKGNYTLTLAQGSRLVDIQKGDDSLKVKGKWDIAIDGDETHQVKGKNTLTIDGDYTIKVKGNLTIKADGGIKLEAGGGLTLKAGTALNLEAGTGLEAKAGTALKLSGGATFELKSSAKGSVNGGGLLEVKGGLVKLN